MATRKVIYLNEAQFEASKTGLDLQLMALNELLTEWEAITGTQIKDSELKTLTTGTADELKNFLFDKLTDGQKDFTLFGKKIIKAKALEMIETPDITPIEKQIKRLRENNNYGSIGYQSERFLIKNGKAEIKPDVIEKIKHGFTIFAETPEELERLEKFTTIIEIINSMYNAGIMPMQNENDLCKIIKYNQFTKQWKLDHTYIKRGRLF
jgi:hypothetical protein